MWYTSHVEVNIISEVQRYSCEVSEMVLCMAATIACQKRKTSAALASFDSRHVSAFNPGLPTFVKCPRLTWNSSDARDRPERKYCWYSCLKVRYMQELVDLNYLKVISSTFNHSLDCWNIPFNQACGNHNGA